MACLVLVGLPQAASAQAVQLEEMTWPEVRDALRAGKTTVIIPVGGTEQNGPHMALDKHNARIKVLAERIASELGNAMVAPVLAYTPDDEHMRLPGTISVPKDAFKSLLDGAARSLAKHGFTDVVLIGDHGGYQKLLAEVAAGFNRGAKAPNARLHFVPIYYDIAREPYYQLLRDRGLSSAQIGKHAGAADTAIQLATVPDQVRLGQLSARKDAAAWYAAGVTGEPGAASAALGRLGVDLIVSRSVIDIRRMVASPH